MITVNFYQEKDWKINTKKVEEAIQKTLTKHGVTGNHVVNVAIVGEEKMEELNKKYYKDKVYEHPIFTFPVTKVSDFVFPPGESDHLGEMVLLKNTDEVLCSLAEHGSLHLIGIHHAP